MIESILVEARKERASFVRDLAYIEEMAFDDKLDSILDKVDHRLYPDHVDDFREAVMIVNTMPDSYEEDQEEMNRILESTDTSMTFEEMIGVDDEGTPVDFYSIW